MGLRATASTMTALAALLAIALAAQPAAANTGFGLNPGTFIAKTHEHVPLEEISGHPTRPLGHRKIDIEAIRDADPVTEAGAHPDATTHFALRPRDSSEGEFRPTGRPLGFARDVVIDLPAGFMANPEVAPVCPRHLFGMNPAEPEQASLCPPSTQVGVATVGLHGAGDPVQTSGLYRIDRPADAPVAFGFVAGGQETILTPELRSEGDYGLVVETRRLIMFPARPTSVTVTLWGVPSDSEYDDERWSVEDQYWGAETSLQRRPFVINPPRCNTGELATDISMRSWQEPDRWVPRDLTDPAEIAEYTALSPEPTDCAALPAFEPELDMRPAVRDAGAPASYETTVTNPFNDDPDGRAGAHVKRVEVTLPEGVGINPSSAGGLVACTDSQAGFGTRNKADCPKASRIGRVSVETPLLPEPLTGHIHVGEPKPDQLLRAFIVLEGFGMVIRLAGEINPDPESGQITAVFDDNPQLPFTELKVRFNGGDRAPLSNPKRCGRHETVTRITSWNGDVHESRSGFTIVGGSGSDCPAVLPFDPWLTAGTASPLAGEHSPFTLRFGRTDTERDLGAIDLELPEGLVAKLAGVELCTPGRADTGNCPASSRVGHAQVGSGAGGQPYWVPGPGKDATAVYLAGPYRGAPLSLSIVIPAQAGPFDLGRVVVRNPMHVDPRTAQVSTEIAESRIFDRFGSLAGVVPGAMPRTLEGIPLNVREVRAILDRDEFTINPTSCDPKQIRATIESAEGGAVERAQRFQAAQCQRLRFEPDFGQRVRGRNSDRPNRRPRIVATVDFPAEEASQTNIRRASVVMPRRMIVDQDNIATTCTRAQFAARECPDETRVGWSVAHSPLLDEPLRGPVHLIASDNPLPDIAADLRGIVDIALQGRIHSQGIRVRNTFDVVPDVPVERFRLNLRGGRDGILINGANLCRQAKFRRVDVRVHAHNNSTAHQRTFLRVNRCLRKRANRLERRATRLKQRARQARSLGNRQRAQRMRGRANRLERRAERVRSRLD